MQALVTVAVATAVYDLEVAGPLALTVLIAVVDAVLGVALGLLASAFADSEFQAVQSMPVIVLPQFFLLRRVVGTLELPQQEGEARGALVASQLVGLVMGRYVLRVEPLASATPDWLVAHVGPTVQRYLTGELDLLG